jgi:RNA polymerase sigma-70 factor (ECF subfamily)
MHVIDWESIVADYGPQVWRTVYRLVSNRDDALDCYQETFLHAARYAARSTVSNWPGLLKQIASAKGLDCLRRRYRTERSLVSLGEAADVPHGGPTPDIQAELSESTERLRRAVAALPQKHAEVFCLREIELMSTAEVANQLQVTLDEVATWLHRAKRKLREVLTQDDQKSSVQP